ncbi:MAG TPA: hypothetical protein VFA20_31590 [Myxococcaceae bacterium]|nr:hypothetical protein [Myxococcaceae bacterium]
MKKRAPATRIRIRLRAIACIFALVACPSEVIGSIPPSQFHFKNVVKPGHASEPGGWKAAQVIITLGDRYGVATCKIEVGVPERNKEDIIGDQLAQQAAAGAADEAARIVLGRGPNLSAVRCRQFIDEMDGLLSRAILGAKVSSFTIAGLQPTTWP